MIALLILATFWIPLIFIFKIWTKNSISVSDIIVFNNENPDGKYIDYVDVCKVYGRIHMKIKIQGEKYDYTCLTKHLKWPIKIDDDIDTAENWIVKAEIVNESREEDVTNVVSKYCGPKGDFFGNPFKMIWMFPEMKNEEKVRLKLYTDYEKYYTIDLKTNDEIYSKDDELFNRYNVQLYDEMLDEFIIAD
jgi:hypothetical protein